MLREAQIPFLLWLPAAVLMHLAGGGGAVEVAKTYSDQLDILRFSQGARAQVRLALGGGPTEIEVLDEPVPAEPPAVEEDDSDEPETKPDEDNDLDSDDAELAEAFADEPETVEPAPPKPEPQKEDPKPPKKPDKKLIKPPEPPEQKEPEPKKTPDPKKIAKVKPVEKSAPTKGKEPPQQVILPPPDKRIAIINDPSLKKDQEDNPNAPRIADHANKTENETMARHRAYDQNTSKPTGGGKPRIGPDKKSGNAAHDERGFSNEVPGKGPPRAGSETGPDKKETNPVKRTAKAPRTPTAGRAAIRARPGSKPQLAGKGAIMPETLNGPNGKWSINPDGGDGRKRRKGHKGRKAVAGRAGIPGPIIPSLPKKYSTNAYGVLDALGSDQLRKEQEKAHNTRLSKHRGVFSGANFQKYRAAIENYDPRVKPGNQTNLNAARVPFASYINKMHNRIHPIFADGFLGSLSGLDSKHKLSNMKLVTHIEMILDGKTGKLLQAGIVKPSGVTALEIAALRSLEAAAPFGMPPKLILSPDGKVYLHWEFYRDPYYACTSRYARPFILKNPPKKRLPPTRPPHPHQPSEGQRYGKRGPLRPER